MQASYWKNGEMLWNHTLAVTTDNDMAHNTLGDLFLRRGELDSAISHFEIALKIRSRNAAAHYNFGGALIENKLGSALTRKGRLSEAIGHYEKAMKLRPDYGDPYFNLGSALFQQGRTDEAMAQWQKALATQPNDAGFHTALGNAFLKKGLQKEAIAEYRACDTDLPARLRGSKQLGVAPRDFFRCFNPRWQTRNRSGRTNCATLEQQRCELSTDSRGCLLGGGSVF